MVMVRGTDTRNQGITESRHVRSWQTQTNTDTDTDTDTDTNTDTDAHTHTRAPASQSSMGATDPSSRLRCRPCDGYGTWH